MSNPGVMLTGKGENVPKKPPILIIFLFVLFVLFCFVVVFGKKEKNKKTTKFGQILE